ncbi:MAG: hydrogenase maturation nickel metallochaperone HypA, partial [Oscillospiraceae bacterium]
MHELGIISAILKTLDQICIDEELTSIEQITLEVGELSGVVPAYIEDCYPAAVYKTPYEDMKLKMEVVPGIARCKDCGAEFNAMECDLKCPKCKSQNLEALSGREFIIK